MRREVATSITFPQLSAFSSDHERSGPCCDCQNGQPGCEAAFEQALHEFVQRSLSLPGQMGVHIIRPAPGSNSRQYGIIRRFADRNALTVFRASPEYLEWNQLATDLTEGDGH